MPSKPYWLAPAFACYSGETFLFDSRKAGISVPMAERSPLNKNSRINVGGTAADLTNQR
jgi:hypothetical protein